MRGFFLPILFAFSVCGGAENYNVRDFGAKGDGISADTKAIQAAIDKCHADGGGVVELSGGIFPSASILLKSGVELRVCEGAALRALSGMDGYFAPEAKGGLSEKGRWHRGLIVLENSQDLRITGGGVIDGGHVEDPRGEEGMRGFHTVSACNVRNVKIDNITFQRASNYALLFEKAQDCLFENVKILEGWDGVHIREGKDILVNKCEFYTGDDSIAGGLWENVRIEDCVLNSSCNGIRLHMPAQNCCFEKLKIFGEGRYAHRTSRERKRRGTYAAIVIQPSAWSGSTVPGNVEGILIKDVEVENVQCALHMSTCKSNAIRNVKVENFRAVGIGSAPVSIENWLGFAKVGVFKDGIMVGGNIISSAPGKIESVELKNFSVAYSGCGDKFKKVPFDVIICDVRPLPWWGFYAKNVNGLRLENFSLKTESPDARAAVCLENVEALEAEASAVGDSEFHGGLKGAAATVVISK